MKKLFFILLACLAHSSSILSMKTSDNSEEVIVSNNNIFKAAKNGDLMAVLDFIRGGNIDLDEIDKDSQETPLLLAINHADNGKKSAHYFFIVYNVLLGGVGVKRADIEKCGTYKGQTPLFRAVARDLFFICEILVGLKANIAIKETQNNMTLIHIAAHQASLRVIKALIEALICQDKIYLLFDKDNSGRDPYALCLEGINTGLQVDREVKEFFEKIQELENNKEKLLKYLDKFLKNYNTRNFLELEDSKN